MLYNFTEIKEIIFFNLKSIPYDISTLGVTRRIFVRRLLPLLLLLIATGCALKTPLSATVTADGKYWVVNRPLIYEHPKTKQRFEVPRGFVTDLASVPRLFWMALPPCGNYTPAAVVHDYIIGISRTTAIRNAPTTYC